MKLTKTRQRRRPQTFSQAFKQRIAAIKKRLDATGSSWAELCERAKVSRSQPVRWAAGTPKTIQLVDQLEAALAAIEKSRKA